MELTKKVKTELTDLFHEIRDNPLPKGHQQACGKGDSYWCCDYWTKEVIRCLLFGVDDYLKKGPQKYLKGNSNYSATEIVCAVDYKMKMLELLNYNRDVSHNILLGECGWGIDIPLIHMITDFNIICYDHNELYESRINSQFTKKVKFITASTHGFEYDKLDGECILICNHSMVKDLDAIFPKDKIKCIIWDGQRVR